MKSRQKTLFAALISLAVLFAGAAVVSGAPGSIDGSQTDTADEVYLSDNKTVDTEFNASGDTTMNLTLQSVPDADAENLAMNVTHEGVEYYEFSGAWDGYNDSDPDADATTNGYYHTFTDDELDRVPVDPTTNETLEVNYFNESLSPENRTVTTITVYVETTDERNVQRVTEDAAFAEVETNSPPIYRPLSDDYNTTTVDDDAAINGSNTTVIYTLDDSATLNPFSDRTEELSDTGAFTLMTADVTGDESETVPVFLNGIPEWYDSEDMGSYAVINANDDKLEFHPSGENFEGENTMEVSASSDVYRVTDIYTVYQLAGGYSGDGLGAVTEMVM